MSLSQFSTPTLDFVLTCLEVTLSRSWQVMMLLNLALIRDSVLSRSEGLINTKDNQHLPSQTVQNSLPPSLHPSIHPLMPQTSHLSR